MTLDALGIITAGRALDNETRRMVARDLLDEGAVMDVPEPGYEDVDRAWKAEARERLQDVLGGKVTGYSLDEVQRHI